MGGLQAVKNTVCQTTITLIIMFACKNLYASNPSRIGEPCPTQPKQVKTIPTIEVGKEGLAAFTVWINVNGFPSTKKMNICTNEGPVGGMRPRDLRSM